VQWRNAEAAGICPGRTALSMRDRYKTMRKKKQTFDDDTEEVGRKFSLAGTPRRRQAADSEDEKPRSSKRAASAKKPARVLESDDDDDDDDEEPQPRGRGHKRARHAGTDESARKDREAKELASAIERLARMSGLSKLEVVAAYEQAAGDLDEVEHMVMRERPRARAMQADDAIF